MLVGLNCISINTADRPLSEAKVKVAAMVSHYKLFAKNSDNSQGKLTFKGSALKRDKLSRSCRRVFSRTTLTKAFMSVYCLKIPL